MKKIKFLSIALIISLLFGCIPTNFYAQTSEKEQTEEILKLIDEYLVQINEELDEIDTKTKKTQDQKEFEYYPAIRLNIDTPFFGMNSVVDQKLRVKKDISTADVATGYSIRDIVSKRIIRLPDTYLGAIVTSTKEYNIDSTMTLPQAKVTLVKCIQYLSQVNSVNEYVDNQTNYIFKDYISDEKKTNINDIKNRIKKVTKQLVSISEKIKKMELMGVDVTEYKTTYTTLATQVYDIKNEVVNTLILEEDLAELKKFSLDNESSIITFETTIENAYQSSLEKLDYGKLLENVSNEYQAKKDTMAKYVEGATTTTTNKDNTQTTVENYKITSASTLDTLKDVLAETRKELKLYSVETTTSTTTENEVEKAKTEEQVEQERKEKIAANEQKVNTLYNKYKEILNKEYKFYIDNTNLLLKDSNDKLNQIYSYLDEDEVQIDNEIFTYTKYIYIDLPSNLANYLDKNNIDSVIELNTLISSLKTEISTLSTNNNKITTIYNKILKELSNS